MIIPVLLGTACEKDYPPFCVHPDNPHYFLFRGKPTVLIGSTEHYGAVLNLDFDYNVYFEELAEKGLNVTRTFSGIYMEPQGAFGIAKNTLAPGLNKLICPWARSTEPGYPGGGNKFDLSKWDDAYIVRLKDFIIEAGKHNIIVELDLFSNFYDTLKWKLSPLYYSNNINTFKPVNNEKEVLSLRHPELLKIQEEMAVKLVTELNSFDNVYYEVCNEPYFGDLQALDAWEKHMTGVIAGAEKELPRKHLISQNIQNGSLKVDDPHPAVSIFNFHYAAPPVTVEMNYGLNKPIGDNETGFRGIKDVRYRTEAWDFLTAGGALYNNLDYSFTTDNEDGSFTVAAGQPGGGGETLREQLGILKRVFAEFDFIHMKPSDFLVGTLPESKPTVRVLAEEGKQYLVYINNSVYGGDNHSEPIEIKSVASSVSLELRAGDYSGTWIDPVTGIRNNFSIARHPGGIYNLTTPPFTEDLALKIVSL